MHVVITSTIVSVIQLKLYILISSFLYILRVSFTAIKNIISEGTTDVEVFNRAFEIDLLKNKDFRDSICKAIYSFINRNNFSELKIHKLGYVLVPKKNLADYRKCTLIDIYDEIVF